MSNTLLAAQLHHKVQKRLATIAEVESVAAAARDDLAQLMHELMSTMTIAQLAHAAGMTPAQVRHWDRRWHQRTGDEDRHYKTQEWEPTDVGDILARAG